MKKKAVEYKGSCCKRCGYNRLIQALHFHHRDRYTKEFPLSNLIKGGMIEKFLRELDKCDLLCANCHAETTAIENTK